MQQSSTDCLGVEGKLSNITSKFVVSRDDLTGVGGESLSKAVYIGWEIQVLALCCVVFPSFVDSWIKTFLFII